ncbi:serine hydrolase domain-containing protein [uncultured Maricaulis sp.]|uniref:serine hydrolase domain-containing protein n=1 Tax=uncultured Maricaulis sp. TaxID=174710 RepID=UPI0030DA6415|tara:strand:+ start:1012 stop:2127 length:1116 start_codon:yes stop_codon:yes gene_type:complete
MFKSIATLAALVSLALPPVLAQDAPQIDAVDAAIAPLMQAGHFPGIAVAVLRDGVPVHIGSYGLAQIENEVPVTPHSVFELASLTKEMTALAVLTLADQGQLSLDDHITDYVENAPAAWADITIDQLLSHMAGLAHRFEAMPNGEFLLNYSTDDMLASAMQTPMVSEPGTDWNYSDQGYFLLGLVIERVTQQSFGAYLQTQYFEQLGMTQTHMLDQAAIVPHRVEGYAWTDGELQRNRRVWQFGLTSHFGVTSSLTDMIAWEAELSDPHIIDPEAITATMEIQRPFDAGANCVSWGYARGWMAYHFDGHDVVDHGGYSGTAYLRDTTTGISVVILTNRQDTPDSLSPTAIAWAVAHAVEPDLPADGPHCWE